MIAANQTTFAGWAEITWSMLQQMSLSSKSMEGRKNHTANCFCCSCYCVVLIREVRDGLLLCLIICFGSIYIYMCPRCFTYYTSFLYKFLFCNKIMLNNEVLVILVPVSVIFAGDILISILLLSEIVGKIASSAPVTINITCFQEAVCIYLFCDSLLKHSSLYWCYILALGFFSTTWSLNQMQWFCLTTCVTFCLITSFPKGGYVFGTVGLSVCVSVCVSVCLFVCG